MSLLELGLAQQLQAFATSLAIGLLLGLERERRPDAKAGLRTFALVALFGTLSGLIADETGNAWIIALGLIIVGAMMVAANSLDAHADHDPGTTSVVALLICYSLGTAVWYRYDTLAAMLAVATTALLYFKPELHGFSRSLTRKDLISILQFAVLSLVVLPILPDENFGPYGAFNPHQVWWMVVLISGLSLAGYAALRIVGPRHGALLIGCFGGLVSSTATTMVFARHAHGETALRRTASVVILLANLMVMLRLGLLSGFVAPSLLVPLGTVLGAGLLFGLPMAVWGWRAHADSRDALPMPEVGNPTELRTALSFGLLYALILFLSAWLEDVAGDKGLYLVALASGLTDVDAITLSTLRLYNLDKLGAAQAVTAIALANLANLAVKAGLVASIGGIGLARLALPGLAAIAVGICGALLFNF